MKLKCIKCENITECRYTFGRFWTLRSSDGTGCDHPFIPDRKRLAQMTAKVEAMKTAREREAEQMEIVF